MASALRRIPLLTILPLLNVTLLAIGSGRYSALGLMIAAIFAYGGVGHVTGTTVGDMDQAPRAGRGGECDDLRDRRRRMAGARRGPGCAMAAIPLKCSVAPAHSSVPASWRARPGINYNNELRCFGYLSFWSVFYALLAVVLYALTLLTFNRCFGRARSASATDSSSIPSSAHRSTGVRTPSIRG